YFFFQAEDGIRDRNVTGVQTCALPISGRASYHPSSLSHSLIRSPSDAFSAACAASVPGRFVWTKPSRLRCGATEMASAPAGTSLRTVVLAPEEAPSATGTGATHILAEPMRACLPTTVRCLLTPS